MKKSRIKYLTEASLVASMYLALSWVSNSVGLAGGAVQLRLSEALCILPFFMPSSVVGLFIGCILTNITTSAAIWDIVFGSLATLIGAFFASKIKCKWLVPLPTVISNAIIVPIVILFCYTDTVTLGSYGLIAVGVVAGEVLSAYALGMVLLLALEKKKGIFDSSRTKH
ncbi:MAG: QueT transporter family protein [Clostridia bacterium]|nr:QueT transporter family protein [Clostridia bacterium]